MIYKATLLLFAAMVPAAISAAQPAQPVQPSHEEQVIRKTYAALISLCAEHGGAAPEIKISNIRSGTIESIGNRSWISMFTVPDDGVVLAGQYRQHDETIMGAPKNWNQIVARWATDDSYTSERIRLLRSTTVTKAVAIGSTEWTAPATYTRYATFNVTISFEGRKVGPYTASFFFGKGSAGEVVSPQDAIVSGQLLWYAVKAR